MIFFSLLHPSRGRAKMDGGILYRAKLAQKILQCKRDRERARQQHARTTKRASKHDELHTSGTARGAMGKQAGNKNGLYLLDDIVAYYTLEHRHRAPDTTKITSVLCNHKERKSKRTVRLLWCERARRERTNMHMLPAKQDEKGINDGSPFHGTQNWLDGLVVCSGLSCCLAVSLRIIPHLLTAPPLPPAPTK